MICRLSGRLERVGDGAIVLALGGVGYEALVPAAAVPDLARRQGEEVTLFTIQYLEGAPTGAHFTPRIVAFLTESDRAFFRQFIRVKGVSIRKALRAMECPVHQMAAAIERSDTAFLTALPEIGRKTAGLIISELAGKLQAFLAPSAAPTPLCELTDAQRIALDIMVSWGDRRADAQRWIAAAVDGDANLKEPDEIVRAAYRFK